jgi:hypothetical protein
MTQTYGMAGLIRWTLISLYLALVLPLPWLAEGWLRLALALAVPIGLALVLAASSERVQLDSEGIRVNHPAWCAWWLRREWMLPWNTITGIRAVSTSQGGKVFYLQSASGSFLIPQRVERFEQFLDLLNQYSGLETKGIGRISPPWTYQLLAALSSIMLIGEVIWAMASRSVPGSF